MSLSIHITNTDSGEGFIYTEKGQRGEKIPASLYLMRIKNESGTSQMVDVTRDAIPGSDPCPPNKVNEPYNGKIRTDGEKGFRIELYEDGLSDNRDSLKGVGEAIRTHIQIHIGPRKSEGCFLLTDDEKGRDNFEKIIEMLKKEDIANGYDHEDMRIFVKAL